MNITDVLKDLQKYGIYLIYGAENDVLSRYEELANSISSTWIVRWTADNPIKCKVACNLLLNSVDVNFDYIAYANLRKTSFEIVKREKLLELRSSDYYTDLCNEHVTFGIRKSDPKSFLIKNNAISLDKAIDNKFTLDLPCDYDFLIDFVQKTNLSPNKKHNICELANSLT